MRSRAVKLGWPLVPTSWQPPFIGRWTPLDLEGKLLAWWDASSGVALSGNQVSSWVDRKNGIAVTQTIGMSRPTWSDGAFPSLVFDGIDDYLDLAANPFPVGSSPADIWNVLQQDAPDADTTVRYSAAYGGVNALSRRLGKTTRSGINRAEITIGDGSAPQYATALTVPFNSRHVVRAAVEASFTTVTLDGGVSAPASVVPNTGAGRFVIGCAPASNSNFWLGRIRDVIVTLPLAADEATKLQAFLVPRRTI